MDLPDLGDHIAGGGIDAAMRLRVTEETACLQSVERPVRTQKMRKVAQVEDVAKHPGNKEEWRLRPSLALMHRHQMREAPRRRSFRDNGLDDAIVTVRDHAALGKKVGTGADRRRLEQDGYREIDTEGLPDPGEQTHRDQRMAAKVEKAVMNPDLRHAQKLLPEGGKRLFDRVFRRGIVGLQLGPVELGAACLGVGNTGGRLSDKAVKVDGADDHLRAPGHHGAAELGGALLGPDALRQVVAQPFFGRRQLARPVRSGARRAGAARTAARHPSGGWRIPEPRRRRTRRGRRW